MMTYLQNHIWCSESNWEGKHYDCRHLVSIRKEEGVESDWTTVIDPKADKVLDEEAYEITCKMVAHPVEKELFARNVPSLRPRILKWLQTNVKDRNCTETPKGWAIGSIDYRARDSASSVTIFFHRKSEAMRFVQTFSRFKKPVEYYQYFTGDRKTLNLDTLKYEETK